MLIGFVTYPGGETLFKPQRRSGTARERKFDLNLLLRPGGGPLRGDKGTSPGEFGRDV